MSDVDELETGSPELLCRIEDRVGVVTLNRPESRNALSLPLKQVLQQALLRLAEHPGVGCVLLTGAPPAFCSGGDTKRMADEGRPPSMEDRQRILRWEHRTPLLLHEMPKPTLAAIPGAAAGAGFSLALACDLRIAGEGGFLLSSFARLGLSGDYGGSWFLTQLVGPAKARELYFTGRRVEAEEGLALGLFNRVVPDAELMDAALDFARQVAAGPPVAHRFMKQNLNRALHADLRTCIDYEADRMVRGAMTEDYQEAVRAFAEKRSPAFSGR